MPMWNRWGGGSSIPLSTMSKNIETSETYSYSLHVFFSLASAQFRFFWFIRKHAHGRLSPRKSSLNAHDGHLTDQFGSLGRLLYVWTVNNSSVGQAGFSILLVGNLWHWAKEQTGSTVCQKLSSKCEEKSPNRDFRLYNVSVSRCSDSWPLP